jgi:chromosome partitioning protein
MRFKVLLTIVAPKPNRDGEEALEYLAGQGIPHFRSSIRRIVAFQRAVLDGVTVDKLDRTNLGGRDYMQVGDEIMQSLDASALHTHVAEYAHTQVPG